jgi:hypothetical protein
MFAASRQLDTLTGMLKDRTVRLCHFAFSNDPFQRVGPPYTPRRGPRMLELVTRKGLIDFRNL